MRNYISYSSRNIFELKQINKITKERLREIEIVSAVLPFKTNNYVTENLINWDDIPNDPIYTLTFPRREIIKGKDYLAIEKLIKQNATKEELSVAVNKIRKELNPHPAGQKHNIPEIEGVKLIGVQHKYRETVLFSLAKDKPAMHIVLFVSAGLSLLVLMR